MIETFLKSQGLEGKPLLLGFSGGPDSTALFYLLLELGQPFQVAHVDHGWRPESGAEAAKIAALCEREGIRCHIRTLALKGANLEDLSRKARHTFFQEVCTIQSLEGVILGHHADDQAETVLKRVFEGASLPKLKGLSSKMKVGDLTIFRPLLNIRKAKILEWLEERKIPYFLDPTNDDTRYLRSRMRAVLLPTLSEQFGKRIETSLCRIGEAAAELSEFLQTLLKPFHDSIVRADEEVSLDFSRFPSQSTFIYKAAIRDLFESENHALSNSVLETLVLHIQKNHSHKTFKIGQNRVEIHRQCLTIKKLKLLSL